MAIEVDALGNQRLTIKIPSLPPFPTRRVRVSADLLHSARSNREVLTDPESFILPERYVESDHADIRNLARTLRGGSDLETARNTYRWVSEQLRYAGFLRNRRGALQAYKSRQGDCTEFADLFVALCRANGIPCRGVAGYVAESNAVLTPNGFHNWAEFYAKGRWNLCDPQGKRFVADCDHYIAMHILADPEQTGATSFVRFKVSDDTLKVRMNS
jgi:transglutaminase-like putative cysteine protease